MYRIDYFNVLHQRVCVCVDMPIFAQNQIAREMEMFKIKRNISKLLHKDTFNNCNMQQVHMKII
jgi:hypothetical protein